MTILDPSSEEGRRRLEDMRRFQAERDAQHANGRVNGTTATAAAAAPSAPGPRLNLTSWADLEAEEATWMPGGLFGVGALNIIAGDGGVGKTRLVMTAAAAHSRRQRFPLQAPPCPDGVEATQLPRGVLFCGAEDAITMTLLPAFLAAGGDKAQAASIESVTVPTRDGRNTRDVGFDFSERAMEALELALATRRYGLVIVDGLTGYVEGDGNGDTQTRRSLMPLVVVLRRHGAIGVGLMHFGKGAKRAQDKLIQSVAFRNVSRAVYYVVLDPEECPGGKPEREDYRRLVFCEKINGGRVRAPFAYRVRDVPLEGSAVRTGGVVWDDAPVTCGLEEALAAADQLPGQAAAQLNTPQTVLKAVLSALGGWAPQARVVAAGAAADIPERTLQYARSKLDLPTKRQGFGKGAVVWWGLPGIDFPTGALQVAPMQDVASMVAADGSPVETPASVDVRPPIGAIPPIGATRNGVVEGGEPEAPWTLCTVPEHAVTRPVRRTAHGVACGACHPAPWQGAA